MDWKERIVADPQVLAGKPAIRGTRISVERVIEHLANGWSEADLLAAFPRVTHDNILACLAYAGAVLNTEQLISLES